MQVMANLMSNAAKFSPDDERVEISLSRRENRYRISVTDHGQGIPDEFRDNVFEKFVQADSSDTRQEGGTGLGLSIARPVVDRHGGDIGFETESGIATTFWFELPKLQGHAADVRGGAS